METDVVEVTGETVIVSGNAVTIEYAEQTAYSDNELLMQLNDNLVNGCALISALIGLMIGYLAVKELLKIWLS